MPNFNNTSKARLSQCDPKLREIMNEIIKYYDFTVITGHRTEAEQMEMYNSVPKRSKKKWPDSKHNTMPSTAIDIAPWPIPTEWGKKWKDRVKFYELKALVFYEAKKRGIPLVFGGDWDSDKDYKDNTFDDLIHFHLKV